MAKNIDISNTTLVPWYPSKFECHRMAAILLNPSSKVVDLVEQ
ncbi:1346_t:CDS:2, partial [Acaulospora colombiana]